MPDDFSRDDMRLALMLACGESHAQRRRKSALRFGRFMFGATVIAGSTLLIAALCIASDFAWYVTAGLCGLMIIGGAWDMRR